MVPSDKQLTSIEICAGAGGQAVGLHGAGFRHLALVEIDKHAVETLRLNVHERKRKGWGWERKNCKVLHLDVNEFKPVTELPDLACEELDLLAGGVPCPPFSIAGKQLGQDDERDLFPRMLALVEELRPRAVMIENVRGLLQPEHKFRGYREQIKQRLRDAGYVICGWEVLEAGDYGVPQLRPRAILVAIRQDCYRGFDWPKPSANQVTVAQALSKTMRRRFGDDETSYQRWYEAAEKGVAPTLVGGSKKHGGADLGPSRAKAAWKALGVDGLGVANDEENADIERDLYSKNNSGPKLTVGQAAIIQGFPEDWEFFGGKTARYRQVGNAFPPPVAKAVGQSIAEALSRTGDVLTDPDAASDDGSLLTRSLLPTQEAVPTRGDHTSDSERTTVG